MAIRTVYDANVLVDAMTVGLARVFSSAGASAIRSFIVAPNAGRDGIHGTKVLVFARSTEGLSFLKFPIQLAAYSVSLWHRESSCSSVS
jgi:hypothetical protein